MDHERGNINAEALRYIAQKTYFAERAASGASFLPGSKAEEILSNLNAIQLNLEYELSGNIAPEDSAAEVIRNYLHNLKTPDVFDLEAQAIHIVDSLADGVSGPDPLDFVSALRSFVILASTINSGGSVAAQERGSRRWRMLEDAFCVELVTRMPINHLFDEGGIDIPSLYERVFANNDRTVLGVGMASLISQSVADQYMRIADSARLMTMIALSNLYTPLENQGEPTPYNQPLTPKALRSLNNEAAYTVERLPLLGAYGITPLVVPAATVALPWDTAVLPPLAYSTDRYEDGAIADFCFLPPDETRRKALAHAESLPDNPRLTRVTIGGDFAKARFRLHHNGQISFGHWYHNVPHDQTEQMFGALNATPAFVRLRGLFIAVAFDAIVPEDVSTERVGGTVPSEYGAIREHSPTWEPVLELLLRRRRELERARVSSRNRQPHDWELPQTPIEGHRKRLAAGYRRRPTAEQEARDYYEKRGLVFPGLPDHMNFVGAYTRGTLLSEVAFRRARFSRGSATRRHLGSMSIRRSRGK